MTADSIAAISLGINSLYKSMVLGVSRTLVLEDFFEVWVFIVPEYNLANLFSKSAKFRVQPRLDKVPTLQTYDNLRSCPKCGF